MAGDEDTAGLGFSGPYQASEFRRPETEIASPEGRPLVKQRRVAAEGRFACVLAAAGLVSACVPLISRKRETERWARGRFDGPIIHDARLFPVADGFDVAESFTIGHPREAGV